MIDAELLTLLTSMNQKIDTLYEMKEKVDSLYEMKEKVDSLYEMKEKIDSLYEMKKKVDSLYEIKAKVVSIDERLCSLENIVTVMQYEHGRKLDLLLDYAKANMEKHDEYDKQFAYMNAKFFDYDIRLSVIEDSAYYKKVMEEKAAFIKESADKGKAFLEKQEKSKESSMN